MDEVDRLDLKRALLVPSAVFASPHAVVAADGLTREQKIEILRRWEFDARAMHAAEEEGTSGADAGSGDDERLLVERIHAALKELGADGGVA
jgi:hypothetical protein